MLKMSELVKLSNTPKSTILYYVKEKLVCEPKKVKANLYLYHESVVKQISFIKYLQENFHSSIAELKAMFEHESFDMNDPYKSLLNVIEILMGADFTQSFSKEQICHELSISQEKLQEIESFGFIFARNKTYTKTEKQMLEIILKSDENEINLIKEYVKLSKQISSIEVKLGLEMLKKNKNLKHFFDLSLILKPYIFNMQILHKYQEEQK